MKIVLFILCGIVVLLIGYLIYDSIKYVCIRGHYERRLEYNVALKIPMMTDVWICDEKMLRKDYNKLNKKCNCK